ncbi:uncharacterized protein TNCT_490741 [Trichonephila clavata]|uniref:Transmembrane protein n=1 Tax=Trichonephila clavata TaxID=2740835 RepID=A0A8X6HIT8_TRICU|nr:uncharacterized protein TNCT_490741 [Trichonephila clavata]
MNLHWLNYLAPKIKEDIVNGKQPRDLKLVDLREIPMLWSEQHKDATHAIDKATETDTKLCNINSEDLQPISESSEEAQIENTVEPTSVDRADRPSSAELYFDNKENSADEKSSKKAIQPIVAGVVGAALLVSCVASYLLIESSKVHVIAVIGGIVGLVCMCFALYNALKPGTKLEKVESVKQPIQSF